MKRTNGHFCKFDLLLIGYLSLHYIFKILSWLILDLEFSDFFQIEALGLKKGKYFVADWGYSPLSPPSGNAHAG